MEAINKMEIRKSDNVTVFGDSIPKGIISTNNKITTLSENVINKVEKYYSINISNFSQFGQTLSRLNEKKIIEKYLDDIKSKGTSVHEDVRNIAVIALGGNDSDFDWKEVAISPTSEHKNKTPLSQFKIILQNMITRLQENNVLVVVSTIAPILPQQYFDNHISKLADGNEVLKFLNYDLTNIQREQEAYNIAILDIAQKNKCKVIDTRSAFLMTRDILSLYCEDGIHPNELGHEYLFKTITETLKKI